ncbi:MAG TPA: transcriptional regulator [Deltaproteobacteria bacterium]|nr:MAG: hypothetical protein A2V21_312175 [Deltaproteobacteria bacterium GWC2_55_46]HBG47389.1 transcriptional regulator [Deltaproteobacteria bacterium]HCY11404.1 transcriptional regulator [Deltaproteobacteria bacterium]
MKSTMSLLKAVADDKRVRILFALCPNELCVCQITAVLGLAPSTVSRHLSILHEAGLVTMRKRGKWVYYSLSGRDAPKNVRELLKWVKASAKDSEEVRRDVKKLKKIISVPPEELCQI